MHIAAFVGYFIENIVNLSYECSSPLPDVSFNERKSSCLSVNLSVACIYTSSTMASCKTKIVRFHFVTDVNIMAVVSPRRMVGR